MKKVLITIIFLNILLVAGFSQAKQPNLMVIPSDLYCNKHYYTVQFENQGMTQKLPDYGKAFANDENLKQVVSKINEMIIDRGYTRDKIKSLENTLKKIQTDQAIINAATSKSSGAKVSETALDRVKRSAKPDIILDIYFDVKRQGPRKYISFNLQGIDAYNSSVVASVSGDGTPALNNSITTGALIEEAVLSHLDNFLDQIQSYFDEMFEMGRMAKFHIHVWDTSPVDMEEEYTYDGEDLELNEILDDWFADNAVGGRYDIEDGSETFMTVAARIPLFDERDRAMDANRYARKITKFLKAAPFELVIKRVPQGLGETWLFIGEK